jgi:N-acylneuraminate cytidylyltransferase
MIALIPARGGSKRIPGKNIRAFHGKPMICWSIEAAQASGLFSRILVSTDDPKIAAVAEAAGAECATQRPADLADDQTGLVPVIQHVIDAEALTGTLALIYATAPFLRPADLQQGMQRLSETSADFAISVTSFPFPIQRAVRIEDGRLAMFSPEHLTTRSQDLPEAYHDAAHFCFGRVEAWQAGKSVFGSGSVPVVLPRHIVQDIDTEEDWTRAELMFAAMQSATGP